MSQSHASNSMVTREFFSAGQVLFRQGTQGDRAYYIETGTLRVERNGTVLAELGPGEIVGELASDITKSATRTATVVTVTQCNLLSFSEPYIEDAMQRADPVLSSLLYTLRARLRATIDTQSVMSTVVSSGPKAHLLSARLRLESELWSALEGEELELFAQPIVDLATGRKTCDELLLRWHHPERGLLTPGAFFDLAEERGMMLELGRWTLPAAAQIVCDPANGVDTVSVNIAPQQLQTGTLSQELRYICTTFDVEPNQFQLELTESALVADPKQAAGEIDSLRALGCPVALDDFGTGYSSFSYLRRFHFDVLKLDKSLVDDVDTDCRARSIIRGLVGLAHELDMTLVAEGIEYASQYEFLRSIGTEKGQGFYFARPAPTSEDR